MIILLDKLIIFIVLYAFSFMQSYFDVNIIHILIVISISCALSYIDYKYIKLLLCIFYTILSFIFPEFTLFLPLIYYDIIISPYQSICILGLFSILINFSSISYISSLGTIILFILIYLIKYRTIEMEKQKQSFINYQDNSKEILLQLENKNKELLEKQDYEVNIATLNERNRISMEIHDNVGHMLSSSILQVGALLSINSNENTQNGLEVLNTTLSEAMNSIRNSVHNIHNDALVLEPQIKSIVENFSFCNITLDYHINIEPTPQITYSFISIIKEALSNVIKHSNATKVNIILREHPGFYQLIFFDNGNSSSKDIFSNGIGLRNIENRIYILNGSVNIKNDNGFHIFVTVPKNIIKENNNESFNNR